MLCGRRSDALEKGHSLREVCDCLKEDGIAITATTLGSYISRIRKKDTLGTAAPSVPVPQAVSVEAVTAPYTISEPDDRAKARDPSANMRRGEANRQVFDYRPELADPDKLI